MNEIKYKNYIVYLKSKLKSLESKIDEFCELTEIKTDLSIDHKIHNLLEKEHILNDIKDFGIKCQV